MKLKFIVRTEWGNWIEIYILQQCKERMLVTNTVSQFPTYNITKEKGFYKWILLLPAYLVDIMRMKKRLF